MMTQSDDFPVDFDGCPHPLRDLLKEALMLREANWPGDRGIACNMLFSLGIQLYGLSRWMCNDYAALYDFCGDCFKTAAADILTINKGWLGEKERNRLAMFWFGRAGHAYRATNTLSRSTYCFFRAYEIALRSSDAASIKYFTVEGWKTVTDRWLFLPKVYGYREKELSLDDFLLRLDGYDFQWLIWFLLQQKNFRIEVTKRTRDGGIDLIGSYHDKEWLIQKQLIVQCKNPRNKSRKISVSTVREMLGVYHLQQPRPDEIMLVTTTDFTAEAKNAATMSGAPIILVNKDKLFELLKDVYETVPFSEDPSIDKEERTILISTGMKKRLLGQLYRRQREISRFGYFIKID